MLVGLCLLLGGGVSYASLTIEITEGVEGALPIAIVPFGWNSGAGAPAQKAPVDIAAVVAADLARTGRFAPLPERDLVARPIDGSQVRFGDWRLLGMENLVIGQLSPLGDGRYEVRFQLFDVYKNEQLAGYAIPAHPDELRRTAHQISDIIYEKLTGQKGAFTTRIAYITSVAHGGGESSYFLKLADADGHNEQTILESRSPLMSPNWSADAQKLAYVSFETGRPQIFTQEVYSGRRQAVTSFKGLNGAPAWSPDGKRLAMTLSKDGNPEIYVMTLATRGLRRITRSPSIDTEPAWSPDGKNIVFTSDRGGRPQLYQVPAAGGRATRLTFEGDYNARAAFAPDGKSLALVHGNGGQFRIAVLELASGNLRVLSDSKLDESPSFAPNGSMVIYATNHGKRGILAAASVDGRVHQRLVLQRGDVREPAWAPFER